VIKQFFMALIVLVILNGCMMWTKVKYEQYRLFDMARGKKTTLTQALSNLRKKRVILVGERHSQKSHHTAQLLIIQALHDSWVSVAIGLEMFRTRSQNTLDRWVSDKISKRDFQKVYSENWNFPWSLYSKIFEYARKIRKQLKEKGVRSFGSKKEDDYYLKQDGF